MLLQNLVLFLAYNLITLFVLAILAFFGFRCWKKYWKKSQQKL